MKNNNSKREEIFNIFTESNFIQFLREVIPGDYEYELDEEENKVGITVFINYHAQYKTDIKYILNVLYLTFPGKCIMLELNVLRVNRGKKNDIVKPRTINMFYVGKDREMNSINFPAA